MKILVCNTGTEFDLQTPYNKCLGGSEITDLLLSRGLSYLEHQVVLLTNAKTKDQDGYLILDNINLFYNYAEQSDIILLDRFLPPEIMDFITTRKVFYLAHDAYDQPHIRWMMNKDSEQFLNKIICVSNWQKQTFINYLGVDPTKLVVLGNAIDYSLYAGYAERDLNKLIFAGIPYKGLEVLPDLFTEIKIKSKNEKLHLDIYSSFELYGNKEGDKEYVNVYQALNNMKGINIFKPVSMRDLAHIFKTSNLYIAPCTYHETFGRLFVEAAASGCIPVCMNNGANREILGNNGFIIDYANIFNVNAFEHFVDTVCELLDKDLYGMRVKAEREMKKWDYMTVCKQLEKILLS